MKNKLILIFVIIVLIFVMGDNCYANSEKITKDLELNSYSSSNGEIIYGCNVDVESNDVLLSINAADYDLPSNLYDYKDEIRLRITYSQEDYKVYDCKVINYQTNEIIEDISEENINRLFNIEYGKSINEKEWSKEIKLSELKENAIYQYTANSTTQFPKIENDIGENCIIYIKERKENVYSKKINMYKEISGTKLSMSFNEYDQGETFRIMYKPVENEELLKLISKDEIINLSNYKDGDQLQYKFEKYIYNDTQRDIAINTKNKFYGTETTDSVVIKKGKIYGFDWMIDTATVSYTTDNIDKNENKKPETNTNTNTDKPDSNKQNNSNKNTNTTKKTGTINNKNTNNVNNTKPDTTVAKTKLPKTGTYGIIFISGFSFVTMMVIWVKLKKYEDVK